MKKIKTQAKIKLKPQDQKNKRTRAVSGANTLSTDQINWWSQPEDKIGGSIQALVQRIDDNNYELRERFMRYARLYGNYEALGWANLSNVNRSEQSNNRPVYNIIQSCVDTVHSKVARDDPTPYFITSGADYFDKLKAEKLTEFVQGGFQEMDLYQIGNNKVFRDASVYGLGGIQFGLNEGTNKIEAEWIFIDEIKVDQYDAQKGLPRSIHRCKMIQKELLLAQYPDKQEIIEELTTTHPHYFRSQDTVIEFVVITESFHLAHNKDMGRHCVILLDEVLLDEDYDDTEFPMVFFQYYEKPVGMYGRSITETILSGQVEINKILMFIQQCQELQASPLIITDSNSEIAEDVLLVNNVARMVPIRSGTREPIFMAPQACDPMIYQHLKDWMGWCYQEVGVSQTSAGGTKQEGVDSAVAMRTMVDIESSRYIQVSKNWDKFWINCAKAYVKLAKRAYEKDPTFKVRYVDKKSKVLREIPWAKVNMPDDMYHIKCDTISAFPQSAAGRIQTITDFITNNFISRERGLEELGMDPDLQDEIKLQTSSLRLTEKRLCEMVEDKIYVKPEKYMNLKLSLNVSEATYNQLQIDGCPDDRLELVRLWIRELTTMITGNDPEVMLLQQAFAPPPPAPGPIAPQRGINPVGGQPSNAPIGA